MKRDAWIVTLALLAVLWGARADAGELFLEAGGVSYHTDRSAGHQERNPAAGLRWQWSDEWGVQAVRYRNSLHGLSTVVAARWTPIQFAGGRVGVLAGMVDGYATRDGNFVPVVVPTIGWQAGPVAVSLLAWPSIEKRGVSGGAALAVSLRIW